MSNLTRSCMIDYLIESDTIYNKYSREWYEKRKDAQISIMYNLCKDLEEAKFNNKQAQNEETEETSLIKEGIIFRASNGIYYIKTESGVEEYYGSLD